MLKLAEGGYITLTTQTEQHDEQRTHTGPIPCNELREEQKQTISALGTLVAV
ncbi:hypothetical protein [Yersinia alsatica]|uniref:hypothetical protein n=1 Tax=Yersinia alsatica TaxID=2890317 RepID=UPI0016438523|nr:hypothetical protein [Yersinia alsatica]